jgi:hypothetical protein
MRRRSKATEVARVARAKPPNGTLGTSKSRTERLAAIARDCAQRLTPEVRSIDHGELLYDERGLPHGTVE